MEIQSDCGCAKPRICKIQMYRFMGRVKATDVRPTDGVLAHKILHSLIARYHTLLAHGCVQRR